MKRVRIGNGCGFWGDNLDAPIRLAADGRLDYLTLEYLAELTMSILAVQKGKNPEAGFATDFLDVLGRLTPILKQQPGLKIITNAGGMNPHGCAAKARDILAKAGLADRKIGIVSGDDLMPRLDDLIGSQPSPRWEEGGRRPGEGSPNAERVIGGLNHLDTGEPLSTLRNRVVSANAYLGAGPIVEALRGGASIIITGRVADASLTVGPAAFEFGWNFNDLDRLASATVAGHLIECGAQATGGLWINADYDTRLAQVGYPIAEIAADGSFTISKNAGTGGSVNLETISEQLLYEVADPAQYLTPDVAADFTSVQLKEIAPNVVAVSAGRANGITDTYKVSIAYRDGFMAAGTLLIAGPNAESKARRSGAIILEKLRQAGVWFAESHIEALGAGDCVPGVVKSTGEPAEVVLRVAVRDANRGHVERFAKEFSPLVTSGYPGTTGYTVGRPPVREVFAYWPALIAKSAVSPRVEII